MADDFNDLQAAGQAVIAGIDQIGRTLRPVMVALAGFESACRGAGMSEPAVAAFTVELARRYGWPPVGSRP